MFPDFMPDPDGFAAMIRERVRKDPRDAERCIRILEEQFSPGLDDIDVDAEEAAILRRHAEKSRLAGKVLRASGRVDPDTGAFAGTEEEGAAILEAAGVFDGWERDCKTFLLLE
jgi:hypothetical protein